MSVVVLGLFGVLWLLFGNCLGILWVLFGFCFLFVLGLFGCRLAFWSCVGFVRGCFEVVLVNCDL